MIKIIAYVLVRCYSPFLSEGKYPISYRILREETQVSRVSLVHHFIDLGGNKNCFIRPLSG